MRQGDVRTRRWIVTTVVGFLLVATQVAPLRQAVYENPLFGQADRAAIETVDAAFERALVAFALARVANAAISFLQDTEVGIAPLGIGVTLAVGEVLDPVNDLVERFSWVMLLSLTALGVQKVLLEVGPWLSVEVILAGSLALLMCGLWWPRRWPYDPAWLGRRLLMLALLVRFCVPLAAYLNQQTYRVFLAERYAVASGAVERGTQELSAMQKKLQVTPRAGQEGSPGALERALDSFSLRGAIEGLRQKAGAMLDNFLALIVVFVLNSVLFPLLFLWGVVKLFRLVLEQPGMPSRRYLADRGVDAPAVNVEPRAEQS